MELCNIVGWCFAVINFIISGALIFYACWYHNIITLEYRKAALIVKQCEELLDHIKEGKS